MKDSDLFSEIEQLASARIEARISDAQVERLQWLVLHNEYARRLYVQYVRDSASLRWWAGEATGAHVDHLQLEDTASEIRQPGLYDSMILPGIADADPSVPKVAASRTPSERAVTRNRSRRYWRFGAAAAVILVVGVASVIFRTSREVVATLDATVDAQWSSSENFPCPGPLQAGEYDLRQGSARLTFGGGAEVIILGPARFTVKSRDAMRLVEGQITAQLTASSNGFSVYTPSVDVKDLGTEFGVAVGSAGTVEVQVTRGHVQLRPASGGPSKVLSAGDAVSIATGRSAATPIPYRPDRFIHELPLVDLADLVAGGDGTNHGRAGGISMTNGMPVERPPSPVPHLVGDGLFHACPTRPCIAGVFTPRDRAAATLLDPDHHVWSFVPATNNISFYPLWAGGRIPGGELAGRNSVPTKIGLIDYSQAGRSVLFVHANKGVTFDLEAIRKRHPNRNWQRFRAVCVNTAQDDTVFTVNGSSEKSDFWVFVDGRRVFSRSPLMRHDPPFQIDVPLKPADHYLTLVSTDGGDSDWSDWVTLGDPRLE